MLNREIPIQQAKEGESYANLITDSKAFIAELYMNNVKDIGDRRVSIKQDRDKYIFAIDGKNKFGVATQANLTLFISDFYNEIAKKEKREDFQKTIVDISRLEKEAVLRLITTDTKEELDLLKSRIETPEAYAHRITDPEQTLRKIEELKDFYVQERKSTRKGTGISRGDYDKRDTQHRKTEKTEIDERLRQLNKIKQQIEELSRNKKRLGDKMTKTNKESMDLSFKQLNDELMRIEKEIPDFVLSRNAIVTEKGDTTPYFEKIGYRKQDAKKLNKALAKINNEYAILDELKLTGAKREEVSKDLQDLEAYLDNVINNPDTFKPTEHPFIPEHIKEFCTLLNIEPTPEQYKELNRIAGLTPEELAKEQEEKQKKEGKMIIMTGARVQENQPSMAADPSFTGYKEAYEKYGIRGVLHQTFDYFPNMKADQKSFWTNALFLGGMGYALFKGVKRLFSKKEEGGMGFFGKLAMLGGVALGSNMLTGKSPIELLDKAINGGRKFEDIKMNFFGKANEASPDAKTYIVNPWEATCMLGTLKVGQLATVIDPKTFKRVNYETLLRTTEEKNKETLQKIGKDDEDGIIRKGLEMIGVNPDNIHTMDQNITIDELYKIYIYNIALKASYLTKNNLKIRSDKEKIVDTLTSSGKEITETDLDKLNAEGIFESITSITDSDETKRNKEALDKEVDLLAGITTDKTQVKTQLRLFYDMMPKDKVGKKEVKIIQSQGLIYLETYGNQTEVDLDKITMKGFTDKAAKEYVFSSIANALKAANLTNYIKKICKDKTTNTENPFYIHPIDKDIKFDNAKLFSTDFDTEIMTAGRGGELKNVSLTLEEHKQEYCDYLNTARPKFRKENRESTLDEIPDKAGLKEDIKKIANGDQAKEKAILIAMNEFYDMMPTANKKITISGTEEALKFLTYDQETTINLKNLSMEGFTRSVFGNATELFKTANLTNYIKKICKDKFGGEKPFYFRMGEITFNDQKIFSTAFDTGIISTGFLGGLKDVSPTLNEYKQEYCDFLNNSKPAFRKKTGTGAILKENVEDIPDDAKMKETIDKFQNIDENTKKEVLIGMNEFYKKRPNAEKMIDIVESGNAVVFKTYNQSTTINLNKKSMEGFTPSGFESYEELFNAVNLTNRIKDMCKDRVANSVNPFKINAGKDIAFDDTRLFSLDSDTEMISAGLGGSLKKLSPTLERYKEYYRDYLNKSNPKFRLDILDKTGMKDKIREITKGDGRKERELMLAINEFYDKMPNADKKIDIIGSGDEIEFKTYGQTTRINIKDKTLMGFTRARFEEYRELFRAANLTNRIRDIVKDQIAVNENPFYATAVTINFDSAKIFSTGFDKRIITTGTDGGLKKVSPILEKYKADYINYLNSLTPKIRKENVTTK